VRASEPAFLAVRIAGYSDDAARIFEDARRRRLLWVDKGAATCTFFHDKIRESLLARLDDEADDRAETAGDVAFVGLGAMFQLWDPAGYQEHSAAVRERSRRQGTTLPPRGGMARTPAPS